MKKYRIILGFIFSLIFIIFQFQPTFAQSSLDGALRNCTTYAGGCAQLAIDLGIKAEVGSIVPAAASQAIPVSAQVLSPTGQVLGTAFAGSFTPAANTTSALFALGGLGAGYAGASAINALRNTASEKYCEAHPTDSVCGSLSFTATNSYDPPCESSTTTVPNAVSYNKVPTTGAGSLTGCGQYYQIYFYNSDGGNVFIGGGREPSFSRASVPWEQWSLPARTEAVNLLTSSDYQTNISNHNITSNLTQVKNLITNHISTTYNPLVNTRSEINTGYSIRWQTGGDTVAIPLNVVTSGTVTGTENITNNLTWNISKTDSTFSTSVNNEVNNFINNNYKVSLGLDGSINTNTTTTTTTNTDGSTKTETKTEGVFNIPEPTGQLPDENGDCNDEGCEQKLNKPNFVSYGIQELSQVFPFDIIGDYSALQSMSTNRQCPQITVWGKTEQICQIRTFFSAVKYPLWVSYLIKCLMSL